jgi:hypothetical protein
MNILRQTVTADVAGSELVEDAGALPFGSVPRVDVQRRVTRAAVQNNAVLPTNNNKPISPIIHQLDLIVHISIMQMTAVISSQVPPGGLAPRSSRLHRPHFDIENRQEFFH